MVGDMLWTGLGMSSGGCGGWSLLSVLGISRQGGIFSLYCRTQLAFQGQVSSSLYVLETRLACYVLHSGLQGGGQRPNKWVRRSRVAIYLGTSPCHARSVALVLSLTTGYVSPQFHLKFDDFFETVQDSKSLPCSDWQRLSQFKDPKEGSIPTRQQVPNQRLGRALVSEPQAPTSDPFNLSPQQPSATDDEGQDDEYGELPDDSAQLPSEPPSKPPDPGMTLSTRIT
jgi:hypothetical protein